jgi:3-oxochol-4-en-24-oyl-CoA dehydrogenase
MYLGLNEDQTMLRETFARFLDQASSPAQVRRHIKAGGFDLKLWKGLAELGTFSMRVPEAAGGLGMGLLDATLVMEEAGRTLAMGPIAETIVVAQLLAHLNCDPTLLAEIVAGLKVATLAFHDGARRPRQWLSAGAHADIVLLRNGDAVEILEVPALGRAVGECLAGDGVAEVDLRDCRLLNRIVEPGALEAFAAALEEWTLLVSAALNGLAREAVRLAAAYASERKAFGVPIGTFQALSHPLANFITDIDGGKLLFWKVIHELAAGEPHAGAHIPLAFWWNAKTAVAACIHALRTFGGYGLTTEYDIHLYNLRAKSWALIHGDPQVLLAQAGRRLFAGEATALPDVGAVSLDFDLGEEARELARELDDFFKATLTPELKAHAHYSWDGHHPVVHRKLAEADLLFPAWPKAKGGRGASPYARHAAAAIWEKHGWTGHATGTTQMAAAMIDRFGSDELKRDVLGPILRGEAICSLGYSEPGSGSDVFAAQTRAVPEGNGWRIDGTKMFTSGANLADYVLLLARTNPGAPKHKGLTMFIVPLKADGISIQPVHTFQDERTNITFYDGVRVPDSYRLGEVDGGVKVMSAALELEHGGGFSKSQYALFEAAVALCRDIPTDEGRKLIDTPDAQMRLARTAAHCLISEMLGLRALWNAEEKLNLPAVGPMTKVFSSEKFLEDASDLLDLTAPASLSKARGPAGFLNLCYRHAHGTTIYGGTSEIHRSMIAERALGLPRSR